MRPDLALPAASRRQRLEREPRRPGVAVERQSQRADLDRGAAPSAARADPERAIACEQVERGLRQPGEQPTRGRVLEELALRSQRPRHAGEPLRARHRRKGGP